MQAEALRQGDARSDADAMILGIALSTGHEIVTRDASLIEAADAFGARVRKY